MRVVSPPLPAQERLQNFVRLSARRSAALAAALACLALAAPSAAALPTGPDGPGVGFKLTVDSGGIGLEPVGEVRVQASSNGQSILANVCWHFNPGQDGSVGAEYTGGGAVAYFPFVGPGGSSPSFATLPLTPLVASEEAVPLPHAERYGPGMQEAGTSRSC